MKKYITCILIIIITSLTSSIVFAQVLTAHFLDVGHGDAIFIELPEGTSMLIDGGMPEYGEMIINYISELGYDELDYVVLTHSHDDHIGGLISVLKGIKVGELLTTTYFEVTELVSEFNEVLKNINVNWSYVQTGDSYEIDGVLLEIIHPPYGQLLKNLRGPNGASIVMKFDYGETSLLLTGDIDQKIEEMLVSEFDDKLKSSVLKCAHHASSAANTEKFLRAVAPEIAIVSTGPSKYNYPSDKIITRIKQNVDMVYRTDEDGTIVITLDGKSARRMN